MDLREPGHGHEPAEARARAAQTVLAEQAREDDRLVLPVPGVRVDRVHPAELGEELARLDLEARVFEIERQRDRLEERLLDLELRLAFRVDEVDEVGLAGHVRVDRAQERELHLLQREAALARIVAAALELLDFVVARGRAAHRGQHVEREVEQLERRAADRARRAAA